MYLNSKMTIPEGRRLPLRFCVEHPTLPEIKDVLEHLGLEYAMEASCSLALRARVSLTRRPLWLVQDKTYPRDLLQRGRVRVLLKDPVSGELKLPEIPSRAARPRACQPGSCRDGVAAAAQARCCCSGLAR